MSKIADLCSKRAQAVVCSGHGTHEDHIEAGSHESLEGAFEQENVTVDEEPRGERAGPEPWEAWSAAGKLEEKVTCASS